MRHLVTGTIAVLALSIIGAAAPSPNTYGGDTYARKVLTNNSTMNVVHANEGARNDGEQSGFGLIVTDNRPSQSAAMPEREDPSAE